MGNSASEIRVTYSQYLEVPPGIALQGSFPMANVYSYLVVRHPTLLGLSRPRHRVLVLRKIDTVRLVMIFLVFSTRRRRRKKKVACPSLFGLMHKKASPSPLAPRPPNNLVTCHTSKNPRDLSIVQSKNTSQPLKSLLLAAPPRHNRRPLWLHPARRLLRLRAQ